MLTAVLEGESGGHGTDPASVRDAVPGFACRSAKAWNLIEAADRKEEAMAMPPVTYPVEFSVDYPDRSLNRLTSAFRIFVAIPILIVLGSVSGGTWQWSSGRGTTVVAAGAGGLLFVGPLLMILFRRKYPRWWFDWNLEL
jgi:hypothetical protein